MGYRQTKYWVSKPDYNLTNLLISLSSEKLGHCLQRLTGHGWWLKHLSIAGLSNTAQCRGCEEEFTEETPIHLFEDCPAFDGERIRIFGMLDPISKKYYWVKLMEFIMIDTIQELIAYRKNSDVHSKD